MLVLSAPVLSAGGIRMLVQSSPLAGSQYHQLNDLKDLIRVGDPLELRREPENRHDPNAVRVFWRGHSLGYLPRKENAAVAKAMDGGEPVSANIEDMKQDPNPWKRLRVSVYIQL